MSGVGGDDHVTITISEAALDDLRTATLERFHDEHGAAERIGRKGLKRMAARAGSRAGRYLHAIQTLDHALRNAEEAGNGVGR